MEQRRFDFHNDESHSLYLQLDNERQQSLIGLMADLIAITFQSQEKISHVQSLNANQNQG